MLPSIKSKADTFQALKLVPGDTDMNIRGVLRLVLCGLEIDLR